MNSEMSTPARQSGADGGSSRGSWIRRLDPNAEADQILELKDPILADVFDDLHIRKMCYGYGNSAQRLLKQMNRASAE